MLNSKLPKYCHPRRVLGSDMLGVEAHDTYSVFSTHSVGLLDLIDL